MGYNPHANVFELFDCKTTEIFICEKILTTSDKKLLLNYTLTVTHFYM
jgi:hypothetical protein